MPRLGVRTKELQAAVRELDDVGVGHRRKKIVQVRRVHHVRRQPSRQAELIATAIAAAHKFETGVCRDVAYEARRDYCAVHRTGLVVNPLPHL